MDELKQTITNNSLQGSVFRGKEELVENWLHRVCVVAHLQSECTHRTRIRRTGECIAELSPAYRHVHEAKQAEARMYHRAVAL